MKLRIHSSHNDSSKMSSNNPPKEIVFLSYQEEQKQENEDQIKREIHDKMEPNIQNQTFNPEERQNLKNAFRYICRLCFKESKNCQDQVLKLFQKSPLDQISRPEIIETINTMANDAQTISGERYFKHYLEHLPERSQIIILEIMMWFLKYKYLRYIKNTNTEKGKRKAMKKQLYLRFKNEVMLPYLDNTLQLKSL